MNTKLTLTIERDIIESAKKYAKSKNRSLSDIIENYLKHLTNKDSNTENELDPMIESLKGAFKLPKNLCKEKKIEGFTTPVIIANTYYLLRNAAKHEVVIDKLNQLLNIIDVTEMNKNVVLNSLNSNFKGFEDALQNFSAVEHGNIKVIITRNIKDFKHSELAILTPESYLKGKEANG